METSLTNKQVRRRINMRIIKSKFKVKKAKSFLSCYFEMNLTEKFLCMMKFSSMLIVPITVGLISIEIMKQLTTPTTMISLIAQWVLCTGSKFIR
jgi:hypothetical protein